jgi:hypothetical protein
VRIIAIDGVNKKVVIRIKDPKLKKIRNNLRNLWLARARDDSRKLQESVRKIKHDENGVYKKYLTAAEVEVVRRLNREINIISEMKDNSICKCRRCIRTDQDMTYNPHDGAWYCVECYDEMQEWTAKRKTGVSLFFP